MRIILGLLVVLFGTMARSPAAEAPLRFDMGPEASPVKEGCVGITESSVYSPG
jgi:hypothetical protein